MCGNDISTLTEVSFLNNPERYKKTYTHYEAKAESSITSYAKNVLGVSPVLGAVENNIRPADCAMEPANSK